MTTPAPPHRVFPDLDAASHALADAVARAAHDTLRQRDRFTLALSGGSTPRTLFDLFRSLDIDWHRTHIFWADERCVPPDDPASNYRMAARRFLTRIDIPELNIHRVHGEVRPYEAAAAAYAGELESVLGRGTPQLDVVLLGMGPDGHTASLFPGSPALDAREPVVAVEAPEGIDPAHRITLTLHVLNASRRVFFLVAGAEKRDALRRAFEAADAAEPVPAGRVRARDELCWFVDRAALGDDAKSV